MHENPGEHGPPAPAADAQNSVTILPTVEKLAVAGKRNAAAYCTLELYSRF